VPLQRIRRQTLSVCLAASAFFGQAVEAKLGAPVSSFSQRMFRFFFLKDQTTKGDTAYLRYSLIGDPQRQKVSPGFAGGVTLTVKEGAISGESLVIRLGDNPKAGKALATLLAINVAYEGIGKDPPSQPAVQEKEIKSYLAAIEAALNGAPQTIRYKGFNSKISLLCTKTKDLLLTITQQ
jgi:hypothetical protein